MQKSTRGLAFFLVYRLIEWKKIHGKNVKQNTLDFLKKKQLNLIMNSNRQAYVQPHLQCRRISMLNICQPYTLIVTNFFVIFVLFLFFSREIRFDTSFSSTSFRIFRTQCTFPWNTNAFIV